MVKGPAKELNAHKGATLGQRQQQMDIDYGLRYLLTTHLSGV